MSDYMIDPAELRALGRQLNRQADHVAELDDLAVLADLSGQRAWPDDVGLGSFLAAADRGRRSFARDLRRAGAALEDIGRHAREQDLAVHARFQRIASGSPR